MTTKTVYVPSIGCDGCVRTIKSEVSDIAGVTSVTGDPNSKIVTIQWDSPATWDEIAAKMVEIDYAPKDMLMPM